MSATTSAGGGGGGPDESGLDRTRLHSDWQRNYASVIPLHSIPSQQSTDFLFQKQSPSRADRPLVAGWFSAPDRALWLRRRSETMAAGARRPEQSEVGVGGTLQPVTLVRLKSEISDSVMVELRERTSAGSAGGSGSANQNHSASLARAISYRAEAQRLSLLMPPS